MTDYFHGGIAGLEIGDRILPPLTTGMPTTAAYEADVCRRDRVYATTELRFARVYAALAPFGGNGNVYKVELDHPIEPDAEGNALEGDAVCSPGATVVDVVERDVDVGVARDEIAAHIVELTAATASSSAAVRPCPASSARRAGELGLLAGPNA